MHGSNSLHNAIGVAGGIFEPNRLRLHPGCLVDAPLRWVLGDAPAAFRYGLHCFEITIDGEP